MFRIKSKILAGNWGTGADRHPCTWELLQFGEHGHTTSVVSCFCCQRDEELILVTKALLLLPEHQLIISLLILSEILGRLKILSF